MALESDRKVPCSLRLGSVQQLPKGSSAGNPAFSSALTPSLQAKISLPVAVLEDFCYTD